MNDLVQKSSRSDDLLLEAFAAKLSRILTSQILDIQREFLASETDSDCLKKSIAGQLKDYCETIELSIMFQIPCITLNQGTRSPLFYVTANN